MSGFGFTPLMGGGGGTQSIVAGGTSFAAWDDLLASTSLLEGDYIVQGDSVYRWLADDGVSGAGFPVQHEMYEVGTLATLATVVGDSAALASEGWTHTLSTGDTTTDGTSVTLSINGSEQEQWTVAPTAGRHVYVSGYIAHSAVTNAQVQTGIVNGTKQLSVTRSYVLGGGAAVVVRARATQALRTGEYASSITGTSAQWWDILYDPDATTGQARVWVDHSPWFGCGTSALESVTNNLVYIFASFGGSGTHSASLKLRNLAVIEGAP